MTVYEQPDPARRDTLDDLYDRLCATFCAALPKTLTIGPDEPPFYGQIFKAVRDAEVLGTMTVEGAATVGGYRNHLKASLFHRIEGWTRQIERKVGHLLEAWDGEAPTGVGISVEDKADGFDDAAKDLVLREKLLRFHITARESMKEYLISTTATYVFGELTVSQQGGISMKYESCANLSHEDCEELIRQKIEEEGIALSKRLMPNAKFDYRLTSPVEVTEVHKPREA